MRWRYLSRNIRRKKKKGSAREDQPQLAQGEESAAGRSTGEHSDEKHGAQAEMADEMTPRLEGRLLKGESLPAIPLTTSLKDNVNLIKAALGNSGDLVIRPFKIPFDKAPEKALGAALIYFDGMVDKKVLNENTLEPLMLGVKIAQPSASPDDRVAPIDIVEDYLLTINEVRRAESVEDAISGVLEGDTALIIDTQEKALVLNSKGWEHRGVQQPTNEAVIRGPRDSFIEILRSNLALLRRKVKTPLLTVEIRKVGRLTATDVALVYIRGLTDQSIIDEVKKRLDGIDVDGILETGYIEEFIEDNPWSPFPQLQYTERPDKVAANLLEGRIAIMVDGSPMVLIVPAVFMQFFQSPEDYYERFMIGSAIRFIRLIGIFTAVTLPALYIALSTFHQEMIPTRLLLGIAAAREPVPFSAFVEALIMELSLELLREASVRLPGPIGNTIGIIGALIVGEAAIRAGLVNPAMVIVVALTAIGSFTAPSFAAAIPLRLVRFPLMIMAAMFGLFGVLIGWLAILVHVVSLRTFGIPYLAPLAPAKPSVIRDTFFRVPLWLMNTRPSFLKSRDRIRQAPITRKFAAKKKPGEEDAKKGGK